MTDGFLCFSRFVGRRRAYFRNFCISSTDDERFPAIFAFRRPTTVGFRRFSHFVGRRQAFFAVLYKFPVGEMQKILKTARREKKQNPESYFV